ncbi:MAG: glycosyltransferase [Bacteroidales bacterium]|nr:glycosyltransferase [Bacteroidales bacterium]
MKSLFITPWYPTKYDAMSGLFVFRHAEAVLSQDIDVHVLYICYHPDVKKHYVEHIHSHGVKQTFFYYPDKKNSITEIKHLFKAWRYWHSHYGLPDIIHLNVLTKQIILPLYIKKRYNIPFVLTEHWTGYLPENGAFYRNKLKEFHKKAITKASMVMPVSDLLADAMKKALSNNLRDITVIPNVVNDLFYSLSKNEYSKTTHPKNKEKFVFLHVSCFNNEAKNTVGIVEATEQLLAIRDDFKVKMVGTGPDFELTKAAANIKGLTNRGIIEFTGELLTEQVAIEMTEADAFILFSNYETAAVVLQEASVMELPIISTAVGIAPMILHPITKTENDIKISSQGILVPQKDTNTLCYAMNYMIDHINDFSTRDNSNTKNEYTYKSIGEKISAVYKQTISR